MSMPHLRRALLILAVAFSWYGLGLAHDARDPLFLWTEFEIMRPASSVVLTSSYSDVRVLYTYSEDGTERRITGLADGTTVWDPASRSRVTRRLFAGEASTTTERFDTEGRLVESVVDPQGRPRVLTTYAYSPDGRTREVRVDGLLTKVEVLDANGWVIEETLRTGGRYRYERDPFGSITSSYVFDDAANAWVPSRKSEYVYDEFGSWIVQITYAWDPELERFVAPRRTYRVITYF